MNIYEAALAAKTGKPVKHTDSKGFVLEAFWDGYNLQWTAIRSTVVVRESTLDGWSIIEEPPKEYTFAEAYEMMKAGKWMECNNFQFRRADGTWHKRDARTPESVSLSGSLHFYTREIEGKWIEVNP